MTSLPPAYPVDLGVLRGYRCSQWQFTFLNQLPSGAPVDVTTLGSAWSGTARSSLQSQVPLALGVDVSQSAAGLVTLSLSAAQMTGLDAVQQLGLDVFVQRNAQPFAVFTARMQLAGAYTHA